MQWNPIDKARFAAEHLPWTFTGRMVDGVQEVSIAELPDFVVYAESDREMSMECTGALTSFLLSYFADGEEPPRPALSAPLPWDPDYAPPPREAVVVSPWSGIHSAASGSIVTSGLTLAPTT